MRSAKLIPGKVQVIWTNKTQTPYTAKLFFINPKPLPAIVHFWNGNGNEAAIDQPNLKAPAKESSKIVELIIKPNESVCAFTNNRDVVCDLEVFAIHVDKPELDLTKVRQATVKVSVSGAKKAITIGPESVSKGLTVEPSMVQVEPCQPAAFKISASERTNSRRKVKFGILDQATSASKTIEVDCRVDMRKHYQSSTQNLKTEVPVIQKEKEPSKADSIFDSMSASYFKNHPNQGK